MILLTVRIEMDQIFGRDSGLGSVWTPNRLPFARAAIWNLYIALGVMIAEESLGPYKDAIARYGIKSAGEIINRGIYTVLASIVVYTENLIGVDG